MTAAPKKERPGEAATSSEPVFKPHHPSKETKMNSRIDITGVKPRASIDGVMGDLSNLAHVLKTAVFGLIEMDHGFGESRNHELDRANALVQVGCDLAEKVVKDLDDAWPIVRPQPALPELDFARWTILDFELAVDGFIRIEHAAHGLCLQTKAMCVRRSDYHPGAAFFRDLAEDWLDFQLNRIVDHLKATRFSDPEHDRRREWILVKVQTEYADPEVSVADFIAGSLFTESGDEPSKAAAA